MLPLQRGLSYDDETNLFIGGVTMLRFVILTILILIPGCGKVDVNAPGVKVKVGSEGVKVNAPGVKVEAGKDGVKVDADKK